MIIISRNGSSINLLSVAILCFVFKSWSRIDICIRYVHTQRQTQTFTYILTTSPHAHILIRILSLVWIYGRWYWCSYCWCSVLYNIQAASILLHFYYLRSSILVDGGGVYYTNCFRIFWNREENVYDINYTIEIDCFRILERRRPHSSVCVWLLFENDWIFI